MAEKVDLNVDIKESTGDYFPTIYIDFMDISYGRLPDYGMDESEEPSFEYARYSMDPENGTHVNGSLSIYFTKEAFEPVEDLSEWIYENFGKLYVYSFLCPYQTINEKVENGVLSTRELFDAMTPGRKSTFTSSDPAYEVVMAELKEAYLSNTWANTRIWRGPEASDAAGAEGDNVYATAEDAGEYPRSYLESRINTPGTWVYEIFWGKDSNYGGTEGAAMNGPWRVISDEELAAVTALNDEDTREEQDYLDAGYSFVETYLGKTLASFGGSTKSDREYNHGTRMNAYKISDLVYTNGKSNVRVEPIFDKDGDQLAVVANIPIDFSVTSNIYDNAGEVESFGAIQSRLADVKSIYYIGVVGTGVYSDSSLGDLSDDNEHPGELKEWAKNLNPTLFNLNFGDITYHKIFASPGGYSNTELTLADQTEEIFVTAADNTPHPSNPIMSLNGTYHASKPVNHAYIVSNMMQLVQQYAPFVDEDRALKQNVANLSRILASSEYTVDILRRLQFFRRTYMQKSSATKSGKLYEAFKKIIYPINRQVMKQPRLKKLRITNNKIIDSRVTAPNLSYIKKSGAGNCGDGFLIPGVGCKGWAQMGAQSPDEGYDDTKDNIYLPRSWHHLARRTLYTIPISGRELMSEYNQFILEEGMPTLNVYGEIIPVGNALGLLDSSGVLSSMDVTYNDDLGNDMMSEASDAITAYYESFVEGRRSGTAFQNPNNLDYDWSGNMHDEDDGDLRATEGVVGDSTNLSQDTVVENKGIFFFDYEKALNSHSKLSFVFPIHHIQRYLGLHVPYEYYRVKKVTMERKESMFLTSMPGDVFDLLDDPLDFVTIKLELLMDNSKSYPFPHKTTYSGFESDDGELFYRYGQPTVRVASADIMESDGISWDSTGDIDAYVAMTRTEEIEGTAESTYDDDGASDYAKGIEFFLDSMSHFGVGGSATIEPNHSREKKSFLSLYNFDAPLGTRSTGGPGSIGTDADPTSRPSGQLFNYEGWVVRGGYRLMAFNYADYMDDDVAYYNTIGINEFLERLDSGTPTHELKAWAENVANHPTYYNVKIEVEDQSLRMVEDIYDIFKGEYDNFVKHYYNRAVASCSFNNIDDRFNDFFVKGINETYPDAKDRYWMRAPYMLNLGRQVFFNTFGESATDDSIDNVEEVFTEIQTQSTKLAKLIGPEDGRMIHLQKFKVDFEKLLNIIKPQVDSPTTTRSGRRLFGTRDGDHSHGEWDSPLFNYHPIYDRVLEVAGELEDPGEDYRNDEVVATKWSDSTKSSHTYIFENAFPIDEQIYGDMFLSNLYSWEYTPPSVEVSFGAMFKWLKNIEYIVDPVSYARSLVPEAEFPPQLRGLYNHTSDTDPGVSERTVMGNLLGNDAAYPPAYLKTSKSNIINGTDRWELWIDQLIAACFLYRWGPTVAAGMGVLYSTNPDSLGTDGDVRTYTDAYDGDGEKNLLSDYTMDDIIDYIAQIRADEAHDGKIESAREELVGLINLRRAGSVWHATDLSSDFDSVFGYNGIHWTNEFLNAIKHSMKPEILTKVRTASNNETLGMPIIKYHKAIIVYTNIARTRAGGWKTEAITTEYGSTGAWHNLPHVYVIPSEYEAYASMGGGGSSMMAGGWHYGNTHLYPEGYPTSIPNWNKARGNGFQIRESVYDYRYPSNFEAPEDTGERTGGGVSDETVTIVVATRTTTGLDADKTLKEEDIGYPPPVEDDEDDDDGGWVMTTGDDDGPLDRAIDGTLIGDTYTPWWMR